MNRQEEAMSAEQRVRAAWQQILIGQPTTVDYDGEWVLLITIAGKRFIAGTKEECFELADAFTNDIKRQVAEVREEIMWQERDCKCFEGFPRGVVCKRILARLQAHLDAISRGLRKEAL